MKFNDIRAWGVWFDLADDLVYVSCRQSDCRAFLRCSPPSVRERMRLVRLDLADCYRDSDTKLQKKEGHKW